MKRVDSYLCSCHRPEFDTLYGYSEMRGVGGAGFNGPSPWMRSKGSGRRRGQGGQAQPQGRRGEGRPERPHGQPAITPATGSRRASRGRGRFGSQAQRRRQEKRERRARVGALFVGLPDVLHGLIASWLGTRDLLELCACSRFFDQTYAGRVTGVGLGTSRWRFSGPDEEQNQTPEGKASRPEQIGGLLSRLRGLRQLVLSGKPIVRAVAEALHASACDGGAGDVMTLHRVEHLEVRVSNKAFRELLSALSANRGGDDGATCVCPGLRHLLLYDARPFEPGVHHDDFDLELLVDALISREQAGAASLLTLRLPLLLHFKSDPALDSNSSLHLSRLLLTSKTCESLEALLMNGCVFGDCMRVMGAYLSSGRAASLRRLHCSWGGAEHHVPGDRATIPAALAAGRLPLLEEVELWAHDVAPEDEAHLAQWASSPSAARLVSLRVNLPPILRAATNSHGLPCLRNLNLIGIYDADGAMLAVVDGMESHDALPRLECLDLPGAGDEGVRRLAAFLTQGRGCSRTLQRLNIDFSTATDEAGTQLGRAMQAGGLTALEQLQLDHNKAWGDATMCALVEALESGKGKSLKRISMYGTGLGSVGYQRILQMVQAGLEERPEISFGRCNIPDIPLDCNSRYYVIGSHLSL